MYYRELHDKVLAGLNQWTSNIRISEFETMDYLAAAQNLFQTETELMRRMDTITIPANTNTADYSFRWEPKQLRVRDDVNKIDYGIRSYDQFMAAATWLNPQQNSNARTSPIIQNPMNEPQDHICSFENRVLRIYPTPTVDLVLTVHYVPYLPNFTSSDPYWSEWFGFTDTLASPIASNATTLTLTNSHSAGTLPADITITDGTNTDTGTASAVSGTGVTFTRVGTTHAFSAGASVFIANRSQFSTMFNSVTPEREFFRFLDGFVEYAISQYLSGIVYDPKAKARFMLAEERLHEKLEQAKRKQPMKGRFMQAAYAGPTR